MESNFGNDMFCTIFRAMHIPDPVVNRPVSCEE